MPRLTVIEQLKRLIREDAKKTRDLVPRRVVGRNTDGSEQVVKMDAECVERDGLGGHQTGQILLLPAAPRYDSRGVGGVPSASRVGGDLIWVESQTPKALPAGSTTNVVISGRGFYDGMTWQYLEADGVTINADVTVNSSTYVNATTYHLSVTVSSTATATTGLPIAYQ